MASARRDFQQLPRVAFEYRLFLRICARQRFDSVDALPITEYVRKVGAEHYMLRADFAAEKIASFDVVNPRIEVQVLEISAWQRSAFRHVGPIGAPDRLLSRDEFAIEA